MLLRFGVQNFLSFRDYTELSFVATRYTDDPAHRFPATGTAHGVLPAIALFGANASGKSNLLFALSALQSEVVRSYADRRPDGTIPHRPFLLNASSSNTPTLLDIDFFLDGVRFHYGFRYNASAILEEWLFTYPKGRRQLWFHRNAELSEPFLFGSHLRGKKNLLADFTRPNSLFLSAAAQHNHEQLKPVYEWFSQRLRSADEPFVPGMVPLFKKNSLLFSSHHQEIVRDLLRGADLGIGDFRQKDLPEFMDEFNSWVKSSPIPLEEREKLQNQIEANPPVAVELGHYNDSESLSYLPVEQESRGTLLMLSQSERILYTLSMGGLLIVDELDSGLHPKLSAALLGLFTSPESNPRGARLLFTTHDESLLEHLRRDEVMLVEKDRDGNSRLVPLSEFQTRGRDDIRRGYSEGRFGGVPILGDLIRSAARVTQE